MEDDDTNQVKVNFIKPDLNCFDGLLMPMKISTWETFNEAVNYQPSSDDIIIATYPKSGTTWMQYIVWEIMKNTNAENDLPFVNEMWYDISKHLELHGADVVKNMVPPRIIKTHNPMNYLRYSDKCRYIYVYRSPWDVAVSFYNNLIDAPEIFGFTNGTESDAIECFLNGYLPWGDYFAQVLSWLNLKEKQNVLIVSYEEMKCDLRASILKVATFLCQDKSLLANENRLNEIIKRVSFESMKDIKFVAPSSYDIPLQELKRAEEYRERKFFVRGSTNYGYDYFNENQRIRMCKKIRDTFLPTHVEVIDLWKSKGVPV